MVLSMLKNPVNLSLMSHATEEQLLNLMSDLAIPIEQCRVLGKISQSGNFNIDLLKKLPVLANIFLDNWTDYKNFPPRPVDFCGLGYLFSIL